ncbi:MAG: putative sugar nucleotidyl transferase [candidate division WOR-3 bacterium]
MLCIYEDEGFTNLGPVVDLRPVHDLRCGRFTLLDKFRRRYPRERIVLWVREELAELVAETHPECLVNVPVEPPSLFFSARTILDKKLPVAGEEAVFVASGQPVGFRLTKSRAWKPGCLGRLQLELPEVAVSARVITYPWHLVELTMDELKREANDKRKVQGFRGAVRVVGSRKALFLARDARIWPEVVISTETGPVYIDRGAQIRPHSFIEGPCYIGPGTVIDGARVRPGCSFGPQCRIGGEVEATVFQGYSNKHHEGYIGHSFIGEWVNLGALTTNSDLKNAYQPVQVLIQGRAIDTGLLKVGCFVGDHAKTAIGTMLNTGTSVGTFANWFEPGLSPKEIPAFAWGRTGRWALGDVLDTAHQVMARRGVRPSPAYERLIALRFERTTTASY